MGVGTALSIEKFGNFHPKTACCGVF